MNSDPARGLRVLVLLVGAGCGQAAHDLSAGSVPLLVLRGHVDASTLTRIRPDAPLVGALIWAGVPSVSPLCLAFDTLEIRAACPDPYGVYYGEIEHAAPVDADGNFTLELFHLPKASVSVGDGQTRIAYGSFIVAEDVNGDGELSFTPPAGRGRGGGGGDGDCRDPGGPGPGPGGPQPGSDNPGLPPDVIVAATFQSLRTDQVRVAFREGGFVDDATFYPAPGCSPPPPGFSFLAASAYPVDGGPAGPCTSLAASTVVEVPPVTPKEGLELMCRPVQRAPRVQEPCTTAPVQDNPPVCLSPQILTYLSAETCPRMTSYALKGCRQDPFCLTPDWDHTAAPPAWWPCE